MNVFPERFRFSFVKGGDTYVCRLAPDEWNDNVINWDRDKKNDSVLTKYADDFTFVLEDADYLRGCFDEWEVSLRTDTCLKVRFVVEVCDPATFGYKVYYSGDVDFYSYEETETGVKVSTFDIGFKTALEANLDTTYEIEIPEEADRVKFDRLRLQSVLKCNCKYWADATGSDRVFESYAVLEDLYENYLEQQTLSSVEKRSGGNWMAKVLKGGAFQLGIVSGGSMVYFDSDDKSPFDLALKLYVNDFVERIWSVRLDPGWLPIGFALSFSFNTGGPETYNLGEGDRIYLTLSSTRRVTVSISAELTLSYFTRKNRMSYIRGLRPAALLSALVEKATGGRFGMVKSELFARPDMRNVLITSGDLIRQMGNGKIKTSLKDFFEAFRAIAGAAYTFGISEGEECLVVEHISDFYNVNKKLGELKDIREFKRSVLNDYVYNRLKIGYKDNTYDEMNGKYEFNTELEFSVDTEAKSKELKLICPYRADMYGIEFLVRDYEKRDTTDSGDDNDVFLFHTGSRIEDDGLGVAPLYELNRGFVLPEDCLAGGTAFNVFFSPKRCLMRQIAYIKSLFRFSGNVLEFTSSPKEYDMVYPEGWSEHGDVSLKEQPGLFRPVLYEFETMVPEGMAQRMQQGYNGYFEVDTGHGVVKGFVRSASENPGKNKSQTWKLIAVE